jgi:hypothetical protein
MDNHRSVADRMRPILQAMERSIDSARRSRVKDPVPPKASSPEVRVAVSPLPLPAATPPPSPTPLALPSENVSAAGRLKAKPKRLNSPFLSPFDRPVYRSQAS